MPRGGVRFYERLVLVRRGRVVPKQVARQQGQQLQARAIEIRDVKIRQAIVVYIAHCCAHSVAGGDDAALLSYIGE